MIQNRIAASAALATFGLAALGGIAFAAPGYAAPDTGSTSTSGSPSGTASASGTSPRRGLPNTAGASASAPSSLSPTLSGGLLSEDPFLASRPNPPMPKGYTIIYRKDLSDGDMMLTIRRPDGTTKTAKYSPSGIERPTWELR
jgi:hypothetical protein